MYPGLDLDESVGKPEYNVTISCQNAVTFMALLTTGGLELLGVGVSTILLSQITQAKKTPRSDQYQFPQLL